MLEEVIEESDSNKLSPVVLVRKKNRNLRFCVEYRKVSDVMCPHRLGSMTHWTRSPETSGSSPWTSRTVTSRLHCTLIRRRRFSRLVKAYAFHGHAFRHLQAPVTFERLLETILKGPTYESCVVYLDDVIVIGCTFQEHLHNLQKMFQRFREAHLNFNLDKCQFFQRELRYLGNTVLPEE
jgi:hypothetical protein